MKKISIIIPTSRKANSVSVNPAIEKITQAFSKINYDLQREGIVYEIIVVTNNVAPINLQNIQLFPQYISINVYQEKELKNINELCTKGISLAKYDHIAIVGDAAVYASTSYKSLLMESYNTDDIIVALKSNQTSFLNFLFTIRLTPQKAMLLFPKKVWNIIKFKPSNDAVFLLEFLKRSQETGFSLKRYIISSTEKSSFILSKFSPFEFIAAWKDILSLQINKIPPICIPAQNNGTMINAGLFYKKQKYITHTTLNTYYSALEAIDKRSILFIFIIISFFIIELLFNPLLFSQTFIGILSCIYLLDVCFNLFLVFKTFQKKSELHFSDKEIRHLKDFVLPTYSILCPLYKEAHIIPQFISSLEKMDWPKEKLDVIILLESDDEESIKAFKELNAPSYISLVVVPDSIPKTKPKACNYGLAFARGEYTVIYDAEDIPDPQQLKKAYLGFKKLGKKVACIQAKLNYYNSNQNLLTRFFTAEYSLWFDITLPSLHALYTVIPLGGTSNHFRTKNLRALHAWDAFNVTEDADLGMRLFKLGYHTAILDSVTLEEGNSQLKNWIRQRSRWIKGYMQTYLVHTKENISFFRERGVHALIFHLVIGGKLAFIIINPILWIVTLCYFVFYSSLGPLINLLYPPFVLYVAIASLIFGNSMYIFFYMMGCVKRHQWSLIKYIYLVPFYWALISYAGFIALYQLIFNPFYWEKTVHGLHLKKISL